MLDQARSVPDTGAPRNSLSVRIVLQSERWRPSSSRSRGGQCKCLRSGAKQLRGRLRTTLRPVRGSLLQLLTSAQIAHHHECAADMLALGPRGVKACTAGGVDLRPMAQAAHGLAGASCEPLLCSCWFSLRHLLCCRHQALRQQGPAAALAGDTCGPREAGGALFACVAAPSLLVSSGLSVCALQAVMMCALRRWYCSGADGRAEPCS